MPEATASIEAFKRYALAFEQGFSAKDWSLVAPHLTHDVGWSVRGADGPFAGTCAGRAQVLQAIQKSCDGFDHRFAVREPRMIGRPQLIPGGVYFAWEVRFTSEGVPEFVLRGEEWDLFREGKLEFHREHIWNGEAAHEHLVRHGARLHPEASEALRSES